MAKYLILGAGMTGLNSAYNLRKDYFLAEKENKVGGLAGSIKKDGFVFDYAEHFLRIPTKEMEYFIQNLMKNNLFSQELMSAIFFKKCFIPYPFQENIRELPINELKKCAKSLIQNYFFREQDKKEFANFEEYIYYQYGEYIANEFMIPYNEKIWSMKTREMNTSWFLNTKFIPTFDLEKIIENIIPKSNKAIKNKQIRWYPKKGGSQAFAESFKSHLSHLALNHKAIKIDLDNREVIFQNGVVENYEKLISTIPLIELIEMLEEIPNEVKKAIPHLKYNSVYCMNLCLDKENEHKYHWLYFPQKKIPFSRLFFSSNFCKNNAPKGKSTCSALITYTKESNFNSSKFEQQTIQALIELGFIKNETEIIDKIHLTIEYGFTLPTLGLVEHLNIIQKFLKYNNIYSIGRYGEWKYAGIEHAIEDGKKIAHQLNQVYKV